MKKTIFTFLSALILFVFANQSFAQVPQGFNYQAVARNSVGVLLQTQPLGVKLSIHQGSAGGTVVYAERQTPTTNQFGLFTVSVGQGTWISGTFNTIDWSTGNYYLQVELDATGGITYTDMGTSQLLTVPYAMYADKVGTSGYTETDPTFVIHPAHGITTTNITNWNTAFGWGNHAGLYRPISWVPAWTDITSTPFQFTSVTNNQLLKYNSVSSKWENWTPNFLTSYTETDPIFVAAPAHGITNTNITNWNTAFGWGNHAGLYRPITWVPAWTDITGKPTFATVATSGSYNDLANKLVAGSGIQITGNVVSTNLSLGVSTTGDILTLTPGNSVIVPGISDANNNSPVVTTKPVNNITSTQAYAPGNVVYYGIPAITETGICYSSTNPQPNIYDNIVTSGVISGNFICILTGLTPNILYYVRAYAKVGSTPYYGMTEIFTSTSISPIPTLSTTQVTSITTTTALSGGNITANGGSAVTAKGVCWNTSTGPTIANSKTTDGSGNGIFTSSMSGLTLNTTYYVRAYATNANGTAYGPELYFKTDATFPTVTTTNPSGVTESSAILGGNVTSQGSTSVTERGICISGNMNPTIEDYKISVGSGTGAFSYSDACLLPNSVYYVRAYATSSVGTAYGVNKTLTTSDAFYEGFETGINTSLWSIPMGGWILSTYSKAEGFYSLYSYTNGAEVTLTRNVQNSGNLTYWILDYNNACCYGSSSVEFYYNGILVNTTDNGSWQKQTIPITAGPNQTFKWKFINNGYDPKAYLDYIIMPK